MKYIEKNEKIERVYSVSCDVVGLTKLLNRIVEKGSYRVDGTFDLPSDAQVDYDKNVIISGCTLPNGAPMYENIKRIFAYESKGQYSYHNDTTAVVGTKVVVPALAEIVSGLIAGDEESIYKFMDYSSHSELVPIDERIVAANDEVNDINNIDYDRKVAALGKLRDVFEQRETGQYFDVEQLRSYYETACTLISFQQVSETKYETGKSVLLIDFVLSK